MMTINNEKFIRQIDKIISNKQENMFIFDLLVKKEYKSFILREIIDKWILFSFFSILYIK